MPRYEVGHGKLFRSKVKGTLVGSWKFWFQGRRVTTGTKDKRQAEGFRRQFLAEMGNNDPAPDCLLVRDVLNLVKEDYERRDLRTLDRLESRIKRTKKLIGHLRADDFRVRDVDAYVDRRDDEGVAPATINRELETIRRGFRLAVEQQRLIRAPHIRMLTVENVREIDLTPAEYGKLIAELREPVRLLTVIAYHIGWRAGRITMLNWPHVDLGAGVIRPPANQAHQKWVGPAPIYGDLEKALLVAQANHEKYWPTVQWVLHRAGEPLKTYRAEWERARRVIGRPDLRFHDLRHAAVTNMIESGIQEPRVMEIVGHKTEAMLRRYMITADRHVQEAGRKLEAYHDRIKPTEAEETVQ